MRKLYRSSRDRKIFGVCGGVAEYLGVDATLLRILLVIVAVFSAGSIIFVYIIAGFVIPKEPYGGPYGPGPAPHGYGWPGSEPRQQPHYGGPSWNHGTGGWPGTGPAAHGGHPVGGAGPAPSAGTQKQGLDAMMEDIEKKALRREIEELKHKISKMEKDSKGE
ncbi:PspC domain-containing protein [Cohnella pontilimi]|uniref:PspC domain-containing protein n=1 Tax=Cohnella pontilimi TaxID=2564100 RepID=A0A4U0F7A2_9BACL|nr:PspC domain-containing protein [Cohnella pontilimi]TJY39864.1 PspC domain-containing protein [Cohnella pontilimi]